MKKQMLTILLIVVGMLIGARIVVAKDFSNFDGEQLRNVNSDESLSFFKIRELMKIMTEAQWKAYVRSLKGRRVHWQGWVDDVDEKFFGGYKLLIDMDSPDKVFSIFDVTFDISESDAMRFHKNQRITFYGNIKSIHNILGSMAVTLENAKAH